MQLIKLWVGSDDKAKTYQKVGSRSRFGNDPETIENIAASPIPSSRLFGRIHERKEKKPPADGVGERRISYSKSLGLNFSCYVVPYCGCPGTYSCVKRAVWWVGRSESITVEDLHIKATV